MKKLQAARRGFAVVRPILAVVGTLGLLGFDATARAQTPSPATVDVHIPMLSETGRKITGAKGAVIGMALGGSDGDAVLLRLNVADIRHVLLADDDLKQASIGVTIEGELPSDARLTVRKAMLETDAARPTTDELATAPIAQSSRGAQGGDIRLDGSLLALLQADLASNIPEQDLWLTAESAGGTKLLEMRLGVAPDAIQAEGQHFATLSVTLRSYPHADLFPQLRRPIDGIYTRVIDGHLSYDNHRLRLWGVCRHFWGGTGALDRLNKMGFNAIRLWGPRNAYSPDSASVGAMIDGEGNPKDQDSLATFDRFFADAKQRGFFIWMAGLHYDPLGVMAKGKVSCVSGITRDDSFIAKKFGTGDDWEAWKKALTAYTKTVSPPMAHQVSQWMFFDRRLREVYRQHLVDLLNHVNPYTGKRYADEEAIAAWELNNEQGLVCMGTEYGIGEWPAYFRDEIKNQWNDWLKRRYGNEDALRSAWGTVREGESLDNGTIAFAPSLRNHLDYPAQRGSDIIHFLWDVTDSFNEQMRNEIRAQAKPGIGAAVVPVIFDTQALPNAAWLSTDARGDAVSFGTYQFTFHSSLSIPPGLYIMDDSTVANKPTLIYETEAARPGPFRVEYPLRVAGLAGYQNWDGVFWHYWKGMGDQPNEGYLAAPLDEPRKNYMDGAIYPDEDPAYDAALSIAGTAFLHGAIAPATNPVVHSIPPSQVFSFEHDHGIDMRRDTFTRGAVAEFSKYNAGNAARENSSVAVPSDANVPAPATQPTAVGLFDTVIHCGSQITYDVPNGRMLIDTPNLKAYVGRTAVTYRFCDGITLDHVTQPFIAFAMLSADGHPLAGADAAKRMYVTAQWNAENTGFAFKQGSPRAGESAGWDGGWANTMAADIATPGNAPVIADAVGYRISFPTAATGQLENYDFALRRISDAPLQNGQVEQRAGGVYMAMLQIAARGDAVTSAQPTTPETQAAPDAPTARVPGAVQASELPDPRFAGLYCPIPVVRWGQGYDAADQYVWESTLRYSGKSKWSDDPSKRGSLQLTGVEGIFAAPADISLNFSDDRLTQIVATFSSAESPAAITDEMNARFGHATQHSDGTLQWASHAGADELKVTFDTSASRALRFDVSERAH
jgi:hypothetical protein